MVVSCENLDVSQEQIANNNVSLIQKQSSMFSYIESTQINNGVECENNILIFPITSLLMMKEIGLKLAIQI